MVYRAVSNSDGRSWGPLERTVRPTKNDACLLPATLYACHSSARPSDGMVGKYVAESIMGGWGLVEQRWRVRAGASQPRPPGAGRHAAQRQHRHCFHQQPQ
eukprot:scaffold669587_cov43-Prasinocladus_malaysianus.AAC.1